MTLKEITDFCAANGLPETRFGRQSIGDPSLVQGMRDGRTLQPKTIARLRAYMERNNGMSAMDRFAEEISKDCSDPNCADPACAKEPVDVKLAAQRAGISYDQGNAYMQRMRKLYRG